MTYFELHMLEKFTDLSGNVVYRGGNDLLTIYKGRLYWFQLTEDLFSTHGYMEYTSCSYSIQEPKETVGDVIDQINSIDTSTLIENVNILSKCDYVVVKSLDYVQIKLNNSYHLNEYVFGMLFREWRY